MADIRIPGLTGYPIRFGDYLYLPDTAQPLSTIYQIALGPLSGLPQIAFSPSDPSLSCCSLEPPRTLHAASPREGVARSDPPASAAPSALAAFATISGGRPRETEEPVTRPEIAGMFFEWTGNDVDYFWRFLGLFLVYLRRRLPTIPLTAAPGLTWFSGGLA